MRSIAALLALSLLLQPAAARPRGSSGSVHRTLASGASRNASHTTPKEVTCAAQPIAFVLAGAYYTAEARPTIASFARNVVAPLGVHPQSAAFVNLFVRRSRKSNKGVPDAASLDGVAASLRAFTVPLRGVSLETVDPTEKLFPAEAPARCAWGCDRVRRAGARDHAYCASAGKKMTHWWGRMALSWDSIVLWESQVASGFRFESVLLSRPDILFSELESNRPCYNTSKLWYSAVSPPDGLWFFNRAVAHDAMNTIRLLVSAGSAARCKDERSCCGVNHTSSYAFSWLPLCHWLSEHWDSGLRLSRFDGVRASVVMRKGSMTSVDVNAVRELPEGPKIISRPTGRHGMHCGWFVDD